MPQIRPLILLLPLLFPLGALAACGAGGGYNERYVGTVTPEGGTHCDPASNATLVLETSTGIVSFVPTDGSLILHGVMDSTGAITASLNTQATGKQPYVLTLSAKRTKNEVTGTYATPLCHARVTLHAAS